MSKRMFRFGSLAVLSLAAAAVALGQFVPPAPSRPVNPTTKPLSQELRDVDELAKRYQELRLRLAPSTQPMLRNTPTTRPTAGTIPLPLATDSKTIPIPTDISKAYVKQLGEPASTTVIMPKSDPAAQSTLPHPDVIIPAP